MGASFKMKAMDRSFYCVVWGLLATTLPIAAAEPVLPVKRERFLLIERSGEDRSNSEARALMLEGTGIREDSDLGKFLTLDRIEKWKVFEDEFVRFEYPDFPEVTVSFSDRAFPIGTNVLGGPVGTVDRNSSRYYTIKAGTVTWAVMMLQDGDWFDEGICLCGAVALRVYVPSRETLRAYDLLESGHLKKMQVLGEKKVLHLFEWTHLPMSQDSYLRLTENLVLKPAAAKSEGEWYETFQQKGSKEDRWGWLAPGMTEAQILKVIGKPDDREMDALIYTETHGDNEWLITTRIRLRKGRFHSLESDWQIMTEIPPSPGTLRWASKLVEDKAKKVTDSEKALLRKSCLTQLLSCPADQWNDWVRVADALHDGGWKEPTLGTLIASRFLEKDVNVNMASILIGDLNPPGTQELVVRRIRFELDEAGREEALKKDYLFSSPLGNFHNLLCQIEGKEERHVFIKEGLVHPHAAIREDAFGWIEKLPESEALEAALKGLKESDAYIRRNSAEVFLKFPGRKEHLPSLRTQAEREKDKSTRETLLKAIRGLEAAK